MMAHITNTTLAKDVKIGDTFNLNGSKYGTYTNARIVAIRTTKKSIKFSIAYTYTNGEGSKDVIEKDYYQRMPHLTFWP